jgi:hypothetical protein
MEPPGWGKHARKFYLWGVCGSGKLTLVVRPSKVDLVLAPIAIKNQILNGYACAGILDVDLVKLDRDQTSGSI